MFFAILVRTIIACLVYIQKITFLYEQMTHQMSAIDGVYEGSYVDLKQSEGVAGE